MNKLRLFDLAYNQLEKFPNPNMFVTKIENEWKGVSTADFIQQAMLISRGLIALGVQANDNIAVVSSNRVEWNTMDIAIQQIGAIMVPLYPNISESDYKYILNDAKVKLCFVGTEEIFKKINLIKNDVSSLEQIYTFDVIDQAPNWLTVADRATEVEENEVKKRSEVIKNEDLVTIIYTSGTTGNPKGVMLSHNNILSNVLACVPIIPADENSRVLTFLPVCHVYERMLHYLYIHLGAAIYFAESMDTIGDNIREVKPHVFTAVPRLLEKVYDRIIAKGTELTGIKRALFFWAVSLAEKYELKGKSWWYRFKLGIARKLIFSKWKEALGGEVRAIASGSAALQPRLARVFLAAGLNLLEGYGLTETSPVIAVNRNDEPNGVCIGTVGPLIEDVQVKIATDGEILVKGPNVMLGYYQNPQATKEAFDSEGWLYTGDIGEFVEGRFLKITDRKKEMFKTSGGKFIVPQIMENTFKESRFIEQIIVVGEGQRFPAAIIVPSFIFLREWAERKEIDVKNQSNQQMIENSRIIKRIQREVDHYNERFGNWEKIKKFELLPEEMSIEGGELTPTLKLKRKVIHQKYKNIIDKIYA